MSREEFEKARNQTSITEYSEDGYSQLDFECGANWAYQFRQAEVDELKNDLRLSIEIGVEQQREANRKLSAENEKLQAKVNEQAEKLRQMFIAVDKAQEIIEKQKSAIVLLQKAIVVHAYNCPECQEALTKADKTLKEGIK